MTVLPVQGTEKKKGLAVMVPGRGYTCAEDLMVRLAAVYRDRGYEVKVLDFAAGDLRHAPDLETVGKRARALMEEQLHDVDWASYDRVVFVMKSIGTALGSQYAKEHGLRPAMVHLTPIGQTLEIMDPTLEIPLFVTDTNDKYIDYHEVEAYAKAHGLVCETFEGVGHALKDRDHPEHTEDVTAHIVEEIASYEDRRARRERA